MIMTSLPMIYSMLNKHKLYGIFKNKISKNNTLVWNRSYVDGEEAVTNNTDTRCLEKVY